MKRWLSKQQTLWQKIHDQLTVANKAAPSRFQSLQTLGETYQALSEDLSYSQKSTTTGNEFLALNATVQQLHQRLYREKGITGKTILHFLINSLPQALRDNSGFIATAAVIFFLGGLLSSVILQIDPSSETYFLPQQMIDQLDKGHLWIDTIQAAPSEATFLMTNNIRVAFLAYVLGFTFGIGSLFTLFQNGLFALGGPLQVCFNHGVGEKLLFFILPHGVLELTTVCIAGGAGLKVGAALLFPKKLSRWQAFLNSGQQSLVLITGCILLLIMAGLIEGLISLNPEISTRIRLSIAALSFLGLAIYWRLPFKARS